MSDALTRKIEELVIQIIAGMDEPEAAIAALVAEERARAFEEAAERIAIDERSERELLDLAREQRNAPGVAMHSYAASALAQHYGAIRAPSPLPSVEASVTGAGT